jgi:divalent metal cation (Fe/Co/Zn/Cd) transporter
MDESTLSREYLSTYVDLIGCLFGLSMRKDVMKTLSGGGAIIWALTANILIAVMKFVCAALGSVAMLSEWVHSVADSANELTLMVGKKFSKKEPSRKHPWGTSRGRYLASFIVAILLFLAGGAYSSYEAVEKMMGISHMGVRTIDASTLRMSLMTCIIAAVLDGLSLHKGIKEARERFVKTHEYGKFNLWRFWIETKSSDLAAVIAEDVLACASLAIAGSCTLMALITGDELWDGIGGLGVGVILIIGSVLLALQVSSLLLGEGVSDHTYDALELSSWIPMESRGLSGYRPCILTRTGCCAASRWICMPIGTIMPSLMTLNDASVRR